MEQNEQPNPVQQEQPPAQNESRFDKVQTELENVKLRYFNAYLAIYHKIVKKKLWRKEIVQEISQFLTDNIPLYMKNFLKKKEKFDFGLIYKIQGYDEGQKVWYIVKIDQDKKEKYFNDINQQDSTIDLEDYGKILYSAYGQEIPVDVLQKLHKQFYMQPSIKARQLNEQAWESQQDKKYEKSIQLYTKSTEYDDHNRTTYNNRGYSYMVMQQNEQAKKDFYKSIQLDRQFANPHKHLSNIFFKENDLEMAELYCKRAIELNPEYSDAKQILDKINQKQQENQIEQELQDNNDYIQQDPFFNISKFNPNYYKQSPPNSKLYTFNNNTNNNNLFSQNCSNNSLLNKLSEEIFDDDNDIQDDEINNQQESTCFKSNFQNTSIASQFTLDSSNTVFNNINNSIFNSQFTQFTQETENTKNMFKEKIYKRRKLDKFTYSNVSVEQEKELDIIDQKIKESTLHMLNKNKV